MSGHRITIRVAQRLEDFESSSERAVVSIGNFDGVHIGHQAVFRTARGLAVTSAGSDAPASTARVLAITFDPSPVSILRPQETPERLTTLEDKLALLELHGVTDAIVLRPTMEMLRTPAEEFLAQVVANCHPRAFVEGPGFRFGNARRGSIETLREFAPRYGYTVHEVPPTRVSSLPACERASSSAVRMLLNDGNVEGAAAMLGRPHRITGTVGTGQGRGGPLGFPTANLEQIPQMLPKPGVYAARAQRGAEVRDASSGFLAAVNVGTQPTFGQNTFRVEAHLLDFSGDLLGQSVTILFERRLRDQKRFDSAEQLVEQIARDVEAVRAQN